MFVVVVTVVVANDVENFGNVVDFQWFPYDFHTHSHQSPDVLHPLETLCHVPFSLSTSTPLVFPLVEMSYMVFL